LSIKVAQSFPESIGTVTMSSDCTGGACLAADLIDQEAIIAAGKFGARVQKKTDAYHQELRWLTKLEEVR
jgi:hypothetical protein